MNTQFDGSLKQVGVEIEMSSSPDASLHNDMMSEKCYACDEEATSVEHVPPKCIFPERKDYPRKDLRKNLLTVPACDLHNSAKSKDDEFLMISLAGMLGNNSIGYTHSLTKVDRAMRRSSYRLIDRIFVKNRKNLKIDLGDNKFLHAIAGTPDIERLDRCFNHIARGIYRHHFNRNFTGAIKTLLGFIMVVDDAGRSSLHQFLLARARRDIQDKPRYGANQEVFYYQLVEPDQFGLELINLCFFENIQIFCALQPENVETPSHLGFELMKRGIPVTFTLDDKEYPVQLDQVSDQ